MKAFVLFLLSGFAAFAQSPILEFAGSTSLDADGINHRHYYRCNPTFSVSQTASGPGLTWNFNGISSLGEKNYTNSAYSTSPYPMPGSTMTTLATPYNSPLVLERYYAALTDSGTSITGYSDDILTLSYSGASAFVGQFPMDYQDTNTNAISGNYWYNGTDGTLTGSFTGTSTTTADAYGTLNTNLEGPESIAVSRIKIVQNADVTMTSGNNTHNGTIVQTMYRYYRENDLWPYISWTRYTVSFPSLSVNQTVTKLEKAFQVLLSDDSVVKEDSFKIAPNPVADRLFVNGSDSDHILISIFDISGRLVLTQKANESGIDVSALSAGVYIARFSNGSAMESQKFIKN